MNRSALAMLLVTAAILFVLVGCGGDAPTGPAEPQEPAPQYAQIGGTWNYTSNQLDGRTTHTGLVVCGIGGGPGIRINQTDSTFTGNLGPTTFQCSTGGPDRPLPHYVAQTTSDSPIINGRVNGDSISFDIETADMHPITLALDIGETSDMHHTGTVSDNRMSGSLTLTLDIGFGPVQLTGTWFAERMTSN